MRLIQITADAFKSQHHICLLRLQARASLLHFFCSLFSEFIETSTFPESTKEKNLYF